MRSQSTHQSGFTLIESLIALSLISISGLAMLSLTWRAEVSFREHLADNKAYFLAIEQPTDETTPSL